MKQLGNLAIICAQRQSVQLHIQEGVVSVLVNTGTGQDVLNAHWDNDSEIEQIVYELNFGKYCSNGEVCSSENQDFKDDDALWNLLLKHQNHSVAIVTYTSLTGRSAAGAWNHAPAVLLCQKCNPNTQMCEDELTSLRRDI